MNVLFIHGMGRTPLSGGRLLRKLRAAGLQTHTFAYSQTIHNFATISDRLASRLSETASQGEYILIGHSLGGVLVRSALASLPPGTRQPVHVFLLGSPVRASRLAKALQDNPIFRVIAGDCGQLLASDERMMRIAPLALPTTAIIGRRTIFLTSRYFGDEPNDGVVSISETSAAWITETVTVPVLHSLLPGSRLVAARILTRIDGWTKPAANDRAGRPVN